MKENNEKKIKNSDEISKLIKAFPKDIAALDKRSVLAKVNSQGSGRQRGQCLYEPTGELGLKGIKTKNPTQ